MVVGRPGGDTLSALGGGYEPWPALSYPAFAPTGYLLHRLVQAIGKLKLATPFEPEWANVVLHPTSRGLDTGPIPYGGAVFAVDLDLVAHRVRCQTSWGSWAGFALGPMSVARVTGALFDTLRSLGVEVEVNPMPQEVADPTLFQEDTEPRPYDPAVANAWWRALVSSWRVIEAYHGEFTGKTPPVGLMWGTFDLRDARYNGTRVPTTGPNAGYIRRNAMDEAQIEVGWWGGNELYPRPAYYSFTYPPPPGIAEARIEPPPARWNPDLNEFVLDYDEVRNAPDPEAMLRTFLESTYRIGADLAGWDPRLIGPGRPV